ncbi:MAG: hypothetical protein IT530_02895 [Burkholderiales bacterium]|nr:hypothetical protein [Burkholderiales bacterium]
MTTPLNAGLIVPINNTTFDGELRAWLPQGSSCTTLRIPRGKGLLTPETLPAYVTQTLSLAERFAHSPVEVVVYGCTAAGFIAGPAGDTQLAHDLSKVTGKPVVTVARSMVLALQQAQVNDIALVTPYLHAVNEQLEAFLLDGGIRVRRFNSFYAADVDALGRIGHDDVARLARETMDADCEALFIACAQLPTRGIIEPLSREFGRPVLSSTWVTTVQALRAGRAQPALP